jgi:pimeloyl-ACP methyl ester carboxylesterase
MDTDLQKAKNMTFGIAIVLIILFAAVTILLYRFQDRLIFLPQPTAPANRLRYASHEIRVGHGDVTLTGWFFKNGISAQHPLIIYYGGNAEDVSLNVEDLGRFNTRSFLFMNYRGYGGSTGRPSESALFDDALFVFDHVVKTDGIDPAHIVLMGRSLGSGVAVHVAARRKVGGIILVTPYDSLVQVARIHYPFFPVRLLLKHRFDSASQAAGITIPALFLTAAADRVVPVRLARHLQKRWGGPVTAVNVEGADHITIVTSPVYWDAINAYLRQRGP